MFVTTKGIVLHRTKYSETSIIVKIFTEDFGTQSFIIKNAFSKKSKINQYYFSSLALLEITFDDHSLHKLSFIKDVNFVTHYKTIPFDPSKNAILFFYNELFYKLLYSSLEDKTLFHLMKNALYDLDNPQTYKPDIHLFFMIDLFHCLGISPENDYSEHKPYFSLEDNRFVTISQENHLYLSVEGSKYFSKLLEHNVDYQPQKQIRNEVLIGMVNYLKINNEHIHSIDSIYVLMDLMK
ncbi:MAG TPA: DNA repair protein RecO [Bacteroidales bacterium]|nr:DNA repair protein RecO [Bacteroidales bacterium]HPS70853.1 DNA repair protein RecO [Bacteroidales bacterium]